MINFVSSNDSRFKTITFGPGLNVLLADRSHGSTDQQTRNGSGKSSLLRLFHFMLGGNADPKSLFRKPALVDRSFALGFTLGESSVIVVRSGADANSHFLSHGELSELAVPFGLVVDAESLPEGWERLTLTRWKEKLGSAFFHLSPDAPKYSPSSRSLLSYLVRRQTDGGFASPFKHSYTQQSCDMQVALSFLLDLDWRIPAAFEQVREEQKSVDAMRSAGKNGALGVDIGSAAELRTEAAISRQRVTDLRTKAKGFRVVEHFRDLQQEADRLTRQLRDIRDSDVIDRELLADLREAAAAEAPPGSEELERLWLQVNLILPDHVRSSYDNVQRFHESVISNRHSYLARESELAKERVQLREREHRRLDHRRSEIMELLSSGGALEQFLALEGELGRAEAEAVAVEQRYFLAEKFASTKAQTDGKRRELLLQLQGDYHDRADRLSKAIILFEQYSHALYDERRGSLVVKETLKGPEFDVEVAGKGSVGIDSMQILCFDFTLMTLLHERGIGPGFLVHDSHIFDGVDERQIASAIMLGARLSETLGFQYIVTMNSDTIPTFPDGFDFMSYVNSVQLTDASDDGGLFGFQFD
jgi:uncharacterized protein YydD (DUF2326 family)